MAKIQRLPTFPANSSHLRLSRRRAMQAGAAAAASLLLSPGRAVTRASAAMSIDPAGLTKYVDPLPIPAVARAVEPEGATNMYQHVPDNDE